MQILHNDSSFNVNLNTVFISLTQLKSLFLIPLHFLLRRFVCINDYRLVVFDRVRNTSLCRSDLSNRQTQTVSKFVSCPIVKHIL